MTRHRTAATRFAPLLAGLTAGITALGAAGVAPRAAAGSADWETSFIAARADADADGKDMLLYFTGSDWCPPCVAIDEKIFAESAFKDSAEAAFVPVLLDFPAKKPQTDAVRRQNQMLQSVYGVEGYPSLMLTDSAGQVYATAGYNVELVKRGPAVYAAHLMKLRSVRQARDTAFAEAESLDGVDRARALDRGLEAVGMELATRFYLSEVRDVMALDADDAAGLRSKYDAVLSAERMTEALAQAVQRMQNGDPRGGLEDVVALQAEFNPQGEMLQIVEAVQAQAHLVLGEAEAARAAFGRSIAADPESARAGDIRSVMVQSGLAAVAD